MPARYTTGYGAESLAHRRELPPAHVVFLLVDRSWMVCPWRRRPHGALMAWEAAALAAVRAVLIEAAAAGRLPELAWVSVAGGVREVPAVRDGSRAVGEWIAVRAHGGEVVPIAA